MKFNEELKKVISPEFYERANAILEKIYDAGGQVYCGHTINYPCGRLPERIYVDIDDSYHECISELNELLLEMSEDPEEIAPCARRPLGGEINSGGYYTKLFT